MGAFLFQDLSHLYVCIYIGMYIKANIIHMYVPLVEVIFENPIFIENFKKNIKICQLGSHDTPKGHWIINYIIYLGY